MKPIIHEEASRCSSLDDKIRFSFGTQHEILRIVDSDGVGEDAHIKEHRTRCAKETARWIGKIIGRMNRSGGAVAQPMWVCKMKGKSAHSNCNLV